MHRKALQTRNYLTQNINSIKVEKSYFNRQSWISQTLWQFLNISTWHSLTDRYLSRVYVAYVDITRLLWKLYFIVEFPSHPLQPSSSTSNLPLSFFLFSLFFLYFLYFQWRWSRKLVAVVNTSSHLKTSRGIS